MIWVIVIAAFAAYMAVACFVYQLIIKHDLISSGDAEYEAGVISFFWPMTMFWVVGARLVQRHEEALAEANAREAEENEMLRREGLS